MLAQPKMLYRGGWYRNCFVRALCILARLSYDQCELFWLPDVCRACVRSCLRQQFFKQHLLFNYLAKFNKVYRNVPSNAAPP